MNDSDTKVTHSSGNVFADIGIPNPEEFMLKAKLARIITKTIEERGWIQQQAAETLGIKQPKVSYLKNGSGLDHFSVERLLEFISKLDREIVITVSHQQKNLPPEKVIIPPISERQLSKTENIKYL